MTTATINIRQQTKYGIYTDREFGTIDGHASARQTYIDSDNKTHVEGLQVANGHDLTRVYSAACGGYGDPTEPYNHDCAACFLGHAHTVWAHHQNLFAHNSNNPWAQLPQHAL